MTVLTLVHGTWGSTEGWVAEGSLLRRELTRRLAPAHPGPGPGGSVTFQEFAWTGANSHGARLDAGTRLAQMIRDGHARHPNARHFVIAHSHGGNVALYALRDPSVRAALTGIVTLGTPFLYARRRRLDRHADIVAWLLLVVSAMVPIVMLSALSLPRLAFACMVASMVLILVLKPALARWIVETASMEQAELEAIVRPPSIEASALAILCTSGDEARGWLRTWDSLARMPFLIGFVLFSVVELAARANLPGVVDGLARRTVHRGLDDLRAFGFDGWTLMFAGGVVVCFAWCAVLMGSGVLRWPGYFRDSLLTNLLIEVGTDRVPTAVNAVYGALIFDIPAPEHGRRLRGRLRHTAICRDAAVIGAVGDWIAARAVVAAHPQAGSAIAEQAARRNT